MDVDESSGRQDQPAKQGGTAKEQSKPSGTTGSLPIQNVIGLIDSHCHLDEAPAQTRGRLISDCKAAGMEALVTVCAKPERLDLMVGLADEYKGFVFATAGIHPLEAASSNGKDIERYIEGIKTLMKADPPKLKAIGEIGIDDFLVKDPAQKRLSRDIFVQFIELAGELRLPIVIHCRDAYPELLKILSDRGAKDVAFHYFNQPQFAKEVQERGWMLSLPVTLAFSEKKVANMLKVADMEHVMLETDSPIDVSGGRRITPLDVRLLAEAIAKEKNEPAETIAVMTAGNAADFFSLF